MLPLYPQAVWKDYEAACLAEELRVVTYRTFCQLWREQLAYITVMKPMTDLCFVCQKNSTAIMRAANLPEEAKSEVCHVYT